MLDATRKWHFDFEACVLPCCSVVATFAVTAVAVAVDIAATSC